MRDSDDSDMSDDEVSAVHSRALGGDSDGDGIGVDVDGLFADRIIYAHQLAQLFSVGGQKWTTRRAKRFLKRSGIGFQMGGPTDAWATTTLELKERYPKLWRLIEAKLVDLL